MNKQSLKFSQSSNYKQSLRSFQDLKKFGIAPILIVIITAAVLGGYFFATNYSNKRTEVVPTPQYAIQHSPTPIGSTSSADMTNWKTYNSDFYSFKLPDEWKQEPTDEIYQQYLNYDPNSPEIKSQPVFDPNTNKGLLKIEISSVTSNNFKDYLEQKKSSKSERDGSWQESKLVVDGQQAVKDDGGTGFIVYVKHPQKPVIISISFGLDFDNYNALTDQILSTFKFTN